MTKTIFSNLERDYLQNPLSVNWKKRGQIKERLSKKVSPNNMAEIVKDLNLIFNFVDEKTKKQIVKKLFLNLKIPSAKKISLIYDEFEKKRLKMLKLIKKEYGEKTKRERVKFYENCKLSEGLLNTKDSKITTKKDYEFINSFLNHPETILSDKFTGDMRYICSSKKTRTIYYLIKEYKKPFKIEDFLSKLKSEKEIIKEFYRRGILLEKSVGWDKFLELCRDLIKKKKYLRNIKSDWIEYDLDVFNLPKDYKKEEVILPEIYKNMNVEFYSDEYD